MGDPRYRPVTKCPPMSCDFGRTPAQPAGQCKEPGRNPWMTAGGQPMILCDPHDLEAERFVASGEAIPARRGQ